MTEQYEIRLAGRVSEALLAAFEGMTATDQPAETVLRGPIRDQAALHGLLHRADELGLRLIAVKRIGGEVARQKGSSDEEEVDTTLSTHGKRRARGEK